MNDDRNQFFLARENVVFCNTFYMNIFFDLGSLDEQSVRTLEYILKYCLRNRLVALQNLSFSCSLGFHAYGHLMFRVPGIKNVFPKQASRMLSLTLGATNSH